MTEYRFTKSYRNKNISIQLKTWMDIFFCFNKARYDKTSSLVKIINTVIIFHMRKKEGRIEKEKCWDGDLKPTDKVIIVHDVLVTSAQIRHALDNLPKTCEKIGLFCLVSRKEYTGVQDVEKRGVPVSQILSLSDDDIKEILNS